MRYETYEPGDWTTEELMSTIEEHKKEQTDNPDWGFNPRQKEVIGYGSKPLHVTAGPGSGKTEVGIIRALKWLLVDGVEPSSVVLATFTEKAAQNLEQRLSANVERLGLGDSVDTDEIWVGTLHQICSDIMRDYRYEGYTNVELLDEDSQEFFVRSESDFVDYLSEGGAAYFDSVVGGVRDDGGCSKVNAASAATTLFNRIGQYRANVDELSKADEEPLRELAAHYKEYRQRLEETGRCDFTVLQEKFLNFLGSDAGSRFLGGDERRDKPPLKRILVDEYQDVNPLQQEVYLDMAAGMENPEITVVGDDDQSLYRFRGATVDCLIEFPERAAARFGMDAEDIPTVQLDRNYRSKGDIVDWFNRYINHYPKMNEPGARAEGKEPMISVRGGDSE